MANETFFHLGCNSITELDAVDAVYNFSSSTAPNTLVTNPINSYQFSKYNICRDIRKWGRGCLDFKKRTSTLLIPKYSNNISIKDAGTISFWAKLPLTASTNILGDTSNYLRLSVNSSGYLKFLILNNSGEYISVTGTTDMTTGTDWVNIILTWNFNTGTSDDFMYIYLNNVEENSITSQDINITSSAYGNIVIGSSQTNSTLSSTIADYIAPTLGDYPENATPAWSKTGTGAVDLSAGTGYDLEIDTVGATTDHVYWGLIDSTYDTGYNGISVRAQIVAVETTGGLGIQVRNSSIMAVMYVKNGTVYFPDGSTYAMNTTSAAHTYDLYVMGATAVVWIDNVKRYQGSPTASAGGYTASWYFGDFDSASGVNVQCLINRVKCFALYSAHVYGCSEEPDALYDWMYWQRTSTGSPTCSSSDNVLTIDTTGQTTATLYFQLTTNTYPAWVTPTSGAFIECHIKFIDVEGSGCFEFGLGNASNLEKVYVYPDTVAIYNNGSTLSYSVDTTTHFRAIRLVVVGTASYVFLDGLLILTGTASANAYSGVWFGDNSAVTGSNIEVEIDRVFYNMVSETLTSYYSGLTCDTYIDDIGIWNEVITSDSRALIQTTPLEYFSTAYALSYTNKWDFFKLKCDSVKEITDKKLIPDYTNISDPYNFPVSSSNAYEFAQANLDTTNKKWETASLSFANTSSSLLLPASNNNIDINSGFTIGGFVKAPAQIEGVLFESPSHRLKIYVNSSGLLQATIYDIENTSYSVTSTTYLTAGSDFVHCCVQGMLNTGTANDFLKLYIDGELEDSLSSQNIKVLENTTCNFVLGNGRKNECDVQYNCLTVPESATPAWSKSGSGTYYCNGSVLTIDTLSETTNTIYWEITDGANWTVTNGVGYLGEIEARVLYSEGGNGALAFGVGDGTKRALIYIYPTKIVVSGTATEVSVDMTEYRLIRVVVTDDDYTEVYINGVKVIREAADSTAMDKIIFGDIQDSSGYNILAEIKRVWYTVSGPEDNDLYG